MINTQEEILSTLSEILKWIRVQATPSVKESLKSVLVKPEYRRLYQALDGKRMQKELAQISRISQPRISQLVSSWQRAGIVEQKSVGKYLRSFNLEDLGIDISGSEE